MSVDQKELFSLILMSDLGDAVSENTHTMLYALLSLIGFISFRHILHNFLSQSRPLREATTNTDDPMS